jgi:hypothetical protein
MAVTTYYAMAADEQLAKAQRTLDAHTVSSTGFCLACGILGPCRPRVVAESIFYRSLRLPRRHPGDQAVELPQCGITTPVKPGHELPQLHDDPSSV